MPPSLCGHVPFFCTPAPFFGVGTFNCFTMTRNTDLLPPYARRCAVLELFEYDLECDLTYMLFRPYKLCLSCLSMIWNAIWRICRVGLNHTFIGIYGVLYGISGREITIHTVIYGVYIRFWPTLQMCKNLQEPARMFGMMSERTRESRSCSSTNFFAIHRCQLSECEQRLHDRVS